MLRPSWQSARLSANHILQVARWAPIARPGARRLQKITADRRHRLREVPPNGSAARIGRGFGLGDASRLQGAGPGRGDDPTALGALGEAKVGQGAGMGDVDPVDFLARLFASEVLERGQQRRGKGHAKASPR